MTELLIGTRRACSSTRASPAGRLTSPRAPFAGEPVEYVVRDPRSGRLLASVTSAFYGPKLWFTDGDADGEWTQADGVALPAGGDEALARVWTIVAGEADETRDAGASWSPRGDGLPQQDAYLTVLRHALASAAEGPRLELYFGTTSGHVFGTGDAASTWFAVAECLPTVHSVVAIR
jgi:hypothetical protein